MFAYFEYLFEVSKVDCDWIIRQWLGHVDNEKNTCLYNTIREFRIEFCLDLDIFALENRSHDKVWA